MRSSGSKEPLEVPAWPTIGAQLENEYNKLPIIVLSATGTMRYVPRKGEGLEKGVQEEYAHES